MCKFNDSGYKHDMRLFSFKLCVLTSYIFLMFGMTSCSHEKNELAHHHDHEHHHDHGHGHEHESEGHKHGSGQEIILEPEQAERMGVKCMIVSPGDFSDAIKVTGKISGDARSNGVATASASGVITLTSHLSVGSHVNKGQILGHISTQVVSGGDNNAAALATLNNAKRELERLAPLFEKKLITAERYNAAVAAYETAKAQYSPAAASGTIVSPINGVITDIAASQGQYVSAGEPVAYISDGSDIILTAQVPERYASLVPTFSTAQIILNTTGDVINLSDLGARRLSDGSLISTVPGYIPVSFAFKNERRMIVGSVVEVYLLGKERHDVISIPLSAVTEQQGNYFVFVKVDDEGYIKSPVELGPRNGRRVEILKGLKAGDNIVTEGVSAIRLAETSGAVPEGHTHSH